MWVVGGEFLHRAPSDSIVTHWGALFMYSGFMGSGHASKDLWSGGGRHQRLGGEAAISTTRATPPTIG